MARYKIVLTLIIFLLLSVSAARADSDSAVSLCRLGDRYLSQGDYGKAVKAFEQAVRIDPEAAAGYAGLGRGYLKLGANEVMSNPALLVLDTGASMTAITPDVASRLGIRLDQAPVGRMQVADGRMVEARAVRLDRVTAGPHSKAGMVVVVVEQRGAELKFEGLLGMDFLRDLHYQVDFKHKVINWAP